jgi:hypothetical protein
MSQKGVDHHLKAAELLEHAAKHQRSAAKYHATGEFEKAAHHAMISHGHLVHAIEHVEGASKHQAENHDSHDEGPLTAK